MFIVSFLLPEKGNAQLIYHPGEGYVNYGIEGYNQYGFSIINRQTNPVYDIFGNFIMNGMPVIRMDEYRTIAPYAGSIIEKDFFFTQYLDRLVVASDTYRNWSTKLIIGDNIRTKFTSLTLNVAKLNGIRWDVDTGDHKFTVVSSRRDRPLFGDLDDRYNSVTKYSTYLLGGHWESRIGVLKLGVSYANQYRIDSLVDTKGNSLKGVTPSEPEPVEYIVVKFSDDSPDDGRGGARVYSLDVYIDGNLRNDSFLGITKHNENEIPRTNTSFPAMGKYVPPYEDFIRDYYGITIGRPLVFESERMPEASGTEYLLYWFKIPENAKSVVFETLVSNDYRISLSEVYLANPEFRTNQPRDRNRATFFYDVLRAEGNVRDGSNMKRERFSYGRQTGVTVVGAQAEMKLKGFEMKAEYNRSFNFLQYPISQGKRNREVADAFFVNVSENYRELKLGMECFNISPDYTTSISVNDITYGIYDLAYPNEIQGGFDRGYNNTMEMDLVDDNDDNDPYPDWYFLKRFSDGVVDALEEQRRGIFPGLDEDGDGRPDTNENDNEIPDYDEPFLQYYVDPDQFDYGEDFNNNDVIDNRENDNKPDYVYDKDLRGYHFSLGTPFLDHFHLTLGHYNTWQIAGGGRNVVSYVKLDYLKSMPLLGEVNFINRLKRVEDNIPNDVFWYIYTIIGESFPATTGYRSRLLEDELLMKDSLVNTAFLDVKLWRIRNFVLRNTIKYEINFQEPSQAGGSNRVRHWTMANRADYTFKFGGFRFIPMIKYMVEVKKDRHEKIIPVHTTDLYPILRAEFSLTPRTAIKFGAQGFPFLKSKHRDLMAEERDYDSEDYIAMISNSAFYGGYEFDFNFGYHLKFLRYKDRLKEYEDLDYSYLFIRLTMGEVLR